MYSRQQIIDMAMALPDACLDAPFESEPSIAVFRHGSTGRWFGILLRAPRQAVGLAGKGQAEVLDLKCDPLVSYGMMQAYPDVVPGYHMNKQHWISLRLKGDLPEETVRMLIGMSYDLTRKKPRRAKRADAP